MNAPANGRHDRGRDEDGYDGGYDGGDDERQTGRVARTVTGLRLSTVEGSVPFPRTTGSGAKGWRVSHIRGHASVTESEPVAEVGGMSSSSSVFLSSPSPFPADCFPPTWPGHLSPPALLFHDFPRPPPPCLPPISASPAPRVSTLHPLSYCYRLHPTSANRHSPSLRSRHALDVRRPPPAQLRSPA